MSITHFLTAAAAIGAIAVPAAAQTSYPYQYPQQGYGYPQQGYGGGGAIEQVINQLLGNRYNVNDRTAVRQCASAAAQQASAQYGRYGRPGYGQQGYGQNYGYGNYANNAAGGQYRFNCKVDYRGRITDLRVNRGQYGYNNGYRY